MLEMVGFVEGIVADITRTMDCEWCALISGSVCLTPVGSGEGILQLSGRGGHHAEDCERCAAQLWVCLEVVVFVEGICSLAVAADITRTKECEQCAYFSGSACVRLVGSVEGLPA